MFGFFRRKKKEKEDAAAAQAAAAAFAAAEEGAAADEAAAAEAETAATEPVAEVSPPGDVPTPATGEQELAQPLPDSEQVATTEPLNDRHVEAPSVAQAAGLAVEDAVLPSPAQFPAPEPEPSLDDIPTLTAEVPEAGLQDVPLADVPAALHEEAAASVLPDVPQQDEAPAPVEAPAHAAKAEPVEAVPAGIIPVEAVPAAEPPAEASHPAQETAAAQHHDLAAAESTPALSDPVAEQEAPGQEAGAQEVSERGVSGSTETHETGNEGTPTPQAAGVPIVATEEPTIYGDSEIVPPTQALPEAVRPARAGWFARLRGGLARTRSQLGSIFSRSRIDESLYEELEMALLASDTGYGTTTWLLDALRERARRDRIQDAAALKAALIEILTELLTPLEQPIDVDRADPLVMMITGVNGAGKTTSIGKLARHLHQIDQSVLLAAGDTFRAAAREQLARWGERNQVHVIANEGGDPAAVAFDAIKAGQARKVNVVMVDTAGRLPTQRHLMDELKKIRRVIGKAMDGAPHEVLLVLDGNTGQNMLAQVQAFDEAVQLTGLVVTKLDGTAKGGAIAALAHTRRDHPLPVYFIGVGEGVEDLQAFSAREFATALLD